MIDWHALPREFATPDIKIFAEDIQYTVNEYAASRTLSADNYLVLLDCSSNGITLTLPSATSHNKRVYTIKKIDDSANKVTIDANGGETIDGELTIELQNQYTYVTIVSDGTEWFIIGGEYVKMEGILEDVLEEQKDANTNLTDLLDEIKKIRIKQDKLAGNMYSEFRAEVEDE